EQDKLKISVYPGKVTLFEMLTSLESSSLGGTDLRDLFRNTPLEPLAANPLLRAIEAPGMKAVMPFEITVQ
ncbi:MAG: hypothetical protein LC114_20185, partial [Bryobacterales bacterium]|nr:hypothetical protein [Bryobacterales bacterium]